MSSNSYEIRNNLHTRTSYHRHLYYSGNLIIRVSFNTYSQLSFSIYSLSRYAKSQCLQFTSNINILHNNLKKCKSTEKYNIICCSNSYQPALACIKSNATNTRNDSFQLFIFHGINYFNTLSAFAI